jgi:hypothetical protein
MSDAGVEEVDVKVFISFCPMELKPKHEPWIKSCAFEELPVVLKSFSGSLPVKILELMLRVADVENPGLAGSHTWSEFLTDCANIVKVTPDFDNLMELLLALML